MGNLFKNWEARCREEGSEDFEARNDIDALVSTAVISDVYRTLQHTDGEMAAKKLAPIQAAFPGRRPKKMGWLEEHLAKTATRSVSSSLQASRSPPRA